MPGLVPMNASLKYEENWEEQSELHITANKIIVVRPNKNVETFKLPLLQILILKKQVTFSTIEFRSNKLLLNRPLSFTAENAAKCIEISATVKLRKNW